MKTYLGQKAHKHTFATNIERLHLYLFLMYWKTQTWTYYKKKKKIQDDLLQSKQWFKNTQNNKYMFLYLFDRLNLFKNQN